MNPISDRIFLITGGAGLIGSHIADQLLAEGAREVRILDNFIRGREENLSAALSSGRVQLHRGDVSDAKLVDDLTKGCSGVFHQAAMRITLCSERPRQCLESMVMGTLNVIESTLKHKVNRLIAASSVSVYGNADTFPISENHHPYNNRTLYGGAKLANEQMYRAFHDMHQLPYVAFRYFNVYGPRMDRTGAYTEVMIRWFYAAMDRQRPKIFGKGEQSMDFVHVSDIARANLTAYKSNMVDEVFNVCTGKEVTLLQLWKEIQQITGTTDLEPIFEQPRTIGPVGRRVGDPAKSRELLNFETEIPITEGLRDLYQWLSTAPRLVTA